MRMVMLSMPRSATHFLKGLIGAAVGKPALEERLHDPDAALHAVTAVAPSRLVYEHFRYSTHHGILDQTRFPDLRLVLLVRHPIDRQISQFTKMKAEGHPQFDGVDSIYEYIHQSFLGAPGREMFPEAFRQFMQDRALDWLATRECLVVRYEELIADPGRILGAVMRHYGTPLSDEALRRHAGAITFESLSGGRHPGEVDEASHYRRGVPGEFRAVFSSADLTRLAEMYQDLFRPLGYSL